MAHAEKISLQRKVPSLEASPRLAAYSKIIINLANENKINVNDDGTVKATQIIVGDDTGETLEYTDPFGTREQAEAQLARLKAYGYHYQAYKAPDAILDPASEIGDGVSINNIYGGIYKRSRDFSRLMRASIEAPHQEEVDHEYKFQSPTERHYEQQLGDLRASLMISNAAIRAEVSARTELGETLTALLAVQSDQINAKVSKTGGESSSFAWSLLSDKFSLYSGSKEVFKADADGVDIDGKITAREGYIGGENGFVIKASKLYSKIASMDSTLTQGVYLGTDGIRLGANFKVDAYGNLTCKSATVQGTLRAKDIQYGGNNGTLHGSGITGGTISTSQMNSYCSGGIIGYNNATTYQTSYYPDYFYAKTLIATKKLSVTSDQISWGVHNLAKSSIIVKNSDGENKLIYFVSWLPTT